MRKEISIALTLAVATSGVYALSQQAITPMQRYLEDQKHYKSLPKLEAPCIKTSDGGIELFLAPKYFDKKGGIMDG